MLTEIRGEISNRRWRIAMDRVCKRRLVVQNNILQAWVQCLWI